MIIGAGLADALGWLQACPPMVEENPSSTARWHAWRKHRYSERKSKRDRLTAMA